MHHPLDPRARRHALCARGVDGHDEVAVGFQKEREFAGAVVETVEVEERFGGGVGGGLVEMVEVVEGEEVRESGGVGGCEIVNDEDYVGRVSIDWVGGGGGGLPLCPERRSSRDVWEPR